MAFAPCFLQFQRRRHDLVDHRVVAFRCHARQTNADSEETGSRTDTSCAPRAASDSSPAERSGRASVPMWPRHRGAARQPRRMQFSETHGGNWSWLPLQIVYRIANEFELKVWFATACRRARTSARASPSLPRSKCCRPAPRRCCGPSSAHLVCRLSETPKAASAGLRYQAS